MRSDETEQIRNGRSAAADCGGHRSCLPPPPAQPKPPAANPAAQATLLGQFGDWGAYTATPGGRKVCFALAKPTSSSDIPPNRRTAANVVYMFVSTRPDEKVKDEVSMLVTGYDVQGELGGRPSPSAAPTSPCTPRTTAPG